MYMYNLYNFLIFDANQSVNHRNITLGMTNQISN